MMSGKRAIDLAIELTKNCNNFCVFCYAFKDHQKNTSHQNLSLKEFYRILKIAREEFDLQGIRFTGGEATLYPHLAELIAFASKELATNVTLMTNGRKLSNPAYCESLYKAGLNSMQISLESHIPEVHDGIVQIKGAWQETVNGIKNALKLRPDPANSVHIKATASEVNKTLLKGTLSFIKELGANSLSMNLCCAAGKGTQKLDMIPALEDRVALIAELQTFARQLGLLFECHYSFDLCTEDPFASGVRHYACGRGRGYLAIDYQGNLLVCNTWGKKGGNILEKGSILRLWDDDILKYHWYGLHLPDKCRMCDRLFECGGVCPLYSSSFGNDHIYSETNSCIKVE